MVKCPFCGLPIEESRSKCPNCGGVNEQIQRFAEDTPTTIADLKAWYEAHRLPPSDVTRFFVGIDTHSPQAFGICCSGQHTVLYQNLTDGTRVLLYNGPDEAYAVNEFYLRLKQVIMNQKARMLQKR